MRFIRKEQIVTTIFNKDVEDNETISIIFTNLNKHNVNFSMVTRKLLPNCNDYINLTFDNVKVKKINEDNSLDFIAFKNGVQTILKNILFENILEINATTYKHQILNSYVDITRWDLLDL